MVVKYNTKSGRYANTFRGRHTAEEAHAVAVAETGIRGVSSPEGFGECFEEFMKRLFTITISEATVS